MIGLENPIIIALRKYSNKGNFILCCISSVTSFYISQVKVADFKKNHVLDFFHLDPIILAQQSSSQEFF
jgi:galactitol-specific phosphotransferase system IIC component